MAEGREYVVVDSGHRIVGPLPTVEELAEVLDAARFSYPAAENHPPYLNHLAAAVLRHITGETTDG